MYKRIPATSFDTYEDVYFAMIDFMQECGFTILSDSAYHLFSDIPDKIKYVYVLKDPNTIHDLCLVYVKEDITVDDGDAIVLFIFDNYSGNGFIYEQDNIAISKITNDDMREQVTGVALMVAEDTDKVNRNRRNRSDLLCIYINKSIMFIYVPIDCYIYSHIYFHRTPLGGHMIYYGNFTKYHIGYERNDIFVFGIMCWVQAGKLSSSDVTIEVGKLSNPEFKGINTMGMVFCSPEASNRIFGNTWFTYSTILDMNYEEKKTNSPPPLLTSFDKYIYTDRFAVPKYHDLYSYSFLRGKTNIGSTLNNSSVLMPMIVYGMREPRIMYNWSAIGETKLVNLIDMSHMHSGQIFIDTGIEKDYHKYVVFPAFLDYNVLSYSFLGIAVEIEAKEKLLHSQSEDYLTINLNDRFRNFDRIEVVYGDNKEIEWRYDDLNVMYDTEGIFNLTKDDTDRCLVYGLKNTDGNSTEYRFTCSESCKIISITGYRE